jgi:hypothetical protein
MIEAKIICSHPCDIPDLGILGLKRSEERWVSVAAADASRDLAKEQRKGNVRVYRKMRKRNMAPKRPAPPFVAASRPPVRERVDPEVVEKHIEVERIVEVESSVDVDELARKMKSELLGDLIPDIKEAIAQEVGKALAQQPQRAPEPAAPAAPAMDASQLESVLEGVLRRVGISGGGGGGSQGGSKTSGPEEPLFIPSAIVDKGAKGKITVKSKKSEETDDLDDAQAALREMKRARRGKKKGNEEK